MEETVIQQWLPLIIVAGSVIGLLMLVAILAKNYIKVPPNRVAVFYGRKHGDKGYIVITGGAKFKIPIVEDVQFMDMAVFQQKLSLEQIPNKDGVKVNVNAVATCKIKSDPASLGAAVERFLGKRPEEIHIIVQENLEGQLRSVVGTMSVEELIKDREKLNNTVKSEAASELDKIGVQIDVLNIQNITDANGYIDALGKTQTAVVMRDAQIGQANANRDATKQSTTAEKDGAVTAADNEAQTAAAQKDRDVKKAGYSALVAAEQATAAQAGPLAEAKALQNVTAEKVRIDEAAAKAQIGVQEQMALVAAKRGEAEKVVPAQKEADAVAAKAAGEKRKQVIGSEGAREAAINAAEGEKQRLMLEGEGQAAKIRAIGLAEGDAIRAKLVAEAEGILKKAEAYKSLNEGAQMQLVLEKLPGIIQQLAGVVGEAAKPFGAIDKVVIIDQGGGNSSGMQKFGAQLPTFLAGLVETLKQTGIDPSQLLARAGVNTTGLLGDGTAEQSAPPAAETKPAAPEAKPVAPKPTK